MFAWACMCKWLAKRHLTEPKHILVMVYGGIGDAIMTIPTLALLREKCPNAKITLLASSASGGHTIYRAFPQFYDDIIVISPTPLSWKEAIAHNLMLMRKKFDCVLISYISAYSLSTLLPAMLSIPKQFIVLVDRHPLRKIYEMLFKERVMLAWESEQRSETLLHQEMLRGVDPNYVPQSVPWRWSLPLPATAYAIAKQWLRDNGLWNEQTNSAKAFALIHAGASKMQNYKKIPAPKFAEAINWLMKRGFAVVVIGTPDESESLAELQAFTDVPLRGCFHLDLLSVCALIQLSAVLLSNDSGLGHLGILLDTPTVRIFGPSFYWGFRKWKPGAFEDVFQPIACSPCLRLGLLNTRGLNAHNCGHRNCLNELDAGLLINSLQTVLGVQANNASSEKLNEIEPK